MSPTTAATSTNTEGKFKMQASDTYHFFQHLLNSQGAADSFRQEFPYSIWI